MFILGLKVTAGGLSALSKPLPTATRPAPQAAPRSSTLPPSPRSTAALLPQHSQGWAPQAKQGWALQSCWEHAALPPPAAFSLTPAPGSAPADKPLISSYQVLAGGKGVYFLFFGEGVSCDSYRVGIVVKRKCWHGDKKFRRWGALEGPVWADQGSTAVKRRLWSCTGRETAPRFAQPREAPLPAPRLWAKPTAEGRLLLQQLELTQRAGWERARGILHLSAAWQHRLICQLSAG